MRSRSDSLVLTFLITIVASTQLLANDKASNDWTIPAQKKDFHVFLLMGQSNMNGAAKLLPEDRTPAPHVVGLTRKDDKIEWAPAAHPLQNYPKKKKFSLGIPFAKEYLKDNPKKTVGLVPVAFGGFSIDRLGKNSKAYKIVMEMAKVAMEKGTLKGILWHQGESDTTKQSKADSYEKKLHQLISDIRRDLGDDDLPFIVGNLAEFYGTGKSHSAPDRVASINQVRGILRAVPGKIANTAFVESTDCKSEDHHMVHFDRTSYIILGKRYAQALKMINGNRKSAVVDSHETLAWLQEVSAEKFGNWSLKELDNIKELDFKKTKVTDRDLRHISPLISLNKLNLDGTQITDQGLKHLNALTSLTSLHLSSTKITDQGLKELRSLTLLDNFDLYCAKITGVGFKDLRSLTSLRRLNLYNAKHINDAGLKEIGSLASLRVLNVHGSNITDAGIKHLSSLTALTNLNLGSTKITGAGFKQLRTLTSLKFFDLSGCKITDQGFKDLEEALPNCKVWR